MIALNYQEWLLETASTFQNLRLEGINLAKEAIGQTLTEDDLYILSLIDKCIRLIDGFLILLSDRNLTCLGILLRVQIDNCLRTYALYAAKDKKEVFQSVVKGNKNINQMLSIDGKPMTDTYLRKRLARIDHRFDSVYREASGFIHHSHKSFYQIASTDDPYILNIKIGNMISEELNPSLYECTEAFHYFVKFQYKLTGPFIESKHRLDDFMLLNTEFSRNPTDYISSGC